jgi:hypothetical protein
MSLRLALWSALLMPLWAIAQTIEVPAWFSESFLDIREDAREAAKEGKRLLLYFGQDAARIARPCCRRISPSCASWRRRAATSSRSPSISGGTGR